jgi:hypothetical protein
MTATIRLLGIAIAVTHTEWAGAQEPVDRGTIA